MLTLGVDPVGGGVTPPVDPDTAQHIAATLGTFRSQWEKEA